MTSSEQDIGPSQSTVAVIAQALHDKFGTNAVAVARDQFEGASDDTLATWSEVLAELKRRADT